MMPLLHVLGDGQEHTATEVTDTLADQFALTPSERDQRTGSQRIRLIASRVHWAMTYLAHAGLAERPRRGVWQATDEGMRVLESGRSTIDADFLAQYPSFRDFTSRSTAAPVESDEADDVVETSEETTGIPRVEDVLSPLLTALGDGQARTMIDAVAAVCESLSLPAAIRALRTASGGTVMENRVGWARTALIRAGLIDQPGPALLKITEAGVGFLATHPDGFPEATLRAECPSYVNWLADMGVVPPAERFEAQPAAWMVRAGESGAYASTFVERSRIMVGWGAVGDVSQLSREDLLALIDETWPTYRHTQRGQVANTLLRFVSDMRTGDVVVTPEPSTRTLLLGEITGPYEFTSPPVVEDCAHTRPVRWIARISRDELSYGAQNSLGTAMTLSRPAHAAELLRLADAHAGDAAPLPVVQAAKGQATAVAADRVAIPANVVAPRRLQADEFHTIPRTVLSLLSDMHTGNVALPDFQRSFVWEPDATRELLVSMVRSFPAGALLFLQGGSNTFKAREAEGAPPLPAQPSYLVLDGQQRLTSLYQAVYGVGESRFFIDVGALLAGSDIDQAVRVFRADRAAALAAPEAQARSLMMPLSAVRDNGTALWRDTIVPLRDDPDKEHVRKLLRDVEYACVDPLLKYSFPVTILPATTPLEAVCTIFETLNRTGKPLTPFELISARAFAGGHSLRDLWSDAVERHPVLEEFAVEPYYLLQCIALRLGASCTRRTVLGLRADDIAAEWDAAVDDMAAVLGLLRDECGVLVPKWLPYRPMLIPLVGAWRKVAEAAGPQQGAMRGKLKRWFWCANFTGEYESSSASLAERDTPVLRDWMMGGPEPAVLRDFAWDSERWRSVTARQQGLYRATMALSLVGRPRDFHTGAPLTAALVETGTIDDHHVFPRAYLRGAGMGNEGDSVLNHCLIDRTTNIRIGKRAPSVYLAEIRAELGHELDDVLDSHGLPTGPPLTDDDFPGFLTWRVRHHSEALAVAAGTSIRPAADVAGKSALDRQLEAVEIALRRLIEANVTDDAELPGHVRERTADRLAATVRRDPSLNHSPASVARYLEYSDLRELQDILTSKALWPRFEARFVSKESVNTRFAQLSELRNRLRHSRTLDEVARKDGEAALLWFARVLAE
ncbi:MAG: winged helix-turn-helix domain-containing protein [Candidatus Dormibacteria bacterium]